MALAHTRGSVVIAALIFIEMIAAGVLFQADQDRVYFLGRPLKIACSFKQATGKPCPGCGLTRGIVLSVHGRLRDAWALSPSGPLLTAGSLALAICMSWYSRFGTPRALRWMQIGFVSYACLAITIWLSAWIRLIAEANDSGITSHL